MNVPENLKYTPEHEWVRVEGGDAVMGITDFAQHELTDIVFVELPEVGRSVTKGDAIAVVESVKAVSDVYAPVSGTIAAVNDALSSQPELVNKAAFGDGWIARITLSQPAELDGLLTPEQYSAQLSAKG
jgi:glycine cleavage system H protein